MNLISKNQVQRYMKSTKNSFGKKQAKSKSKGVLSQQGSEKEKENQIKFKEYSNMTIDQLNVIRDKRELELKSAKLGDMQRKINPDSSRNALNMTAVKSSSVFSLGHLRRAPDSTVDFAKNAIQLTNKFVKVNNWGRVHSSRPQHYRDGSLSFEDMRSQKNPSSRKF